MSTQETANLFIRLIGITPAPLLPHWLAPVVLHCSTQSLLVQQTFCISSVFLCTPHVCSQGRLYVILDLPSLLLGSMLLVSQLCALGAKHCVHFRAQDAVGAQ